MRTPTRLFAFVSLSSQASASLKLSFSSAYSSARYPSALYAPSAPLPLPLICAKTALAAANVTSDVSACAAFLSGDTPPNPSEGMCILLSASEQQPNDDDHMDEDDDDEGDENATLMMYTHMSWMWMWMWMGTYNIEF
eukprot:CAMPEP_0119202144 /NCGR_PEP_ID=MMETSP1316-20130426/31187_2 /TAXON_ID=41880 /ORGANISM="Pycnococcus provasolii, Strain RCC2336" /LENGTH=137 /DNA_ID=CAMNT_0007198319 /DNA_START=176 /DNA_END=590 /DNA_ORIENTATION=-